MPVLVDRRKRNASIFIDDPFRDSLCFLKRIRLSDAAALQLSPSPPPSAAAASYGCAKSPPLSLFRDRFPEMDRKPVERVFEASSNDLDFAIKCLNDLSGSQARDMDSFAGPYTPGANAMPCAASCFAQICSPKAVVSSHLTVSAHPFSIEPSNTESSPRLPAPIEPGEAPSSPAAEPVQHEISSGEKRRTQFLFVEDERFTPLSTRPRLQLRSKTTRWRRRRRRRRPLWSRIFFASKKVRSIILLNVLTVINASDIPVLKEVEAIINPASFNMMRFVVSAIPFLPFMIQERGDGDTRSAGVELGFWMSCGCLSQAIGLLTSEAGHASFISAFTVVIVPLVDGIFGARVPAFIWFGAIISLTGVALLECGGSPPCVGDILNMLSAVFFGIHMLRTEQVSRTTRKEKIMALLGYQVCTVALFTIIWFVLRNVLGNVHNWNIESCTWSKMWDWMSSFPWIPTLYTGVFSTGLCLWAEMNAMNDVSATETALVYGLEPVWGAAFAWFLLGERWGITEWIGATLVLCGSLAVQILSSIAEGSKDEFVNNSIHLDASQKQSDLLFNCSSQLKKEPQ